MNQGYIPPQKRTERPAHVSARMYLVSAGSQDAYMEILMYQGYSPPPNRRPIDEIAPKKQNKNHQPKYRALSSSSTKQSAQQRVREQTQTRQNNPSRLGAAPAGVVGARSRCCPAATVPAAVVFACQETCGPHGRANEFRQDRQPWKIIHDEG